MKRRVRFEIFKRRSGYYWRLVGGNGRTMATGGERFPTRAHATRAATRVRTVANGALISQAYAIS